MRLKSVSFKNFRCFTDEQIEFDNYTALVGANNAGKSAVLAALNIFFRSSPRSIPLSLDDFYKRLPNRELEIKLTFADLTKEENDDFDHYVRSGELTFFIKATSENGIVKASLHGSRLANPAFSAFFEMGTAAEKKKFYEALPSDLKLPTWKNQAQAEEALRKYEDINTHKNEPLASATNAFGVEGPIPRIRKYIDFVYIPAVKDATDEATEARNTAFSRLVDRAVRAKLNVEERISAIRETAKKDIDELSANHNEALEDLSKLIGSEYRKFNSAESQVHLQWGKFDEKNLQINLPPVLIELSDDLIKNPVAKFGHGMQRNYIIALLLVSATYDFTKLQKLILACEEPELYQHPPQAKRLATALQSLSDNRTQVVVSTHSPYFITAKMFENIRVIRRTPGEKSKSYRWSVDENCSMIAKAKNEDPISTKASRAKLNQFLQTEMNEMFFAPALILVEGEEDKALLSRYFQATDRQAEILNRGVEIVPTSGKGNLVNAITIARGFEIPFYVVFDGDMNCRPEELEATTKSNRVLLALLGNSTTDGNIAESAIEKNFCVWRTSIQSEFSDTSAWQSSQSEIAKTFGWKVKELRKSSMFLEAVLDNYLQKTTAPHLERLAESIIAFFASDRPLS